MTYQGSSSTADGQMSQYDIDQFYPYGRPEPENPNPGPSSPLQHHWANNSPVITFAIIIICSIAWLVELYGYFLNQDFYMHVMGNGAFIPALAGSKPWMFVSSLFLHSTNVTHILFNMLTLWAVGPTVEQLLGHWRYLALYLLSGIGGSVGMLVSAVIMPKDWSVSAVGASGAIFGLFGAVLVVYRHSGIEISSMLIFLGINLAMPLFIPNIAWQDHLGGFVTGCIVALAVLFSEKAQLLKTRTIRMWISGLLIAIILMVIAAYCMRYNPISVDMLPFLESD